MEHFNNPVKPPQTGIIRSWLSFVPVFVLAALVLAGIKTFSLQSAAGGYCLGGELCDREETLSRYVHIARPYLLEPISWTEKVVGVNADLFYGLLCCVLLACVGYLMSQAYADSANNRSAQKFRLFYLAVLCSVSLFMNGRGVPAFAGFALLIAGIVLHEARRIGRPGLGFMATLGLWLTSVSTGAFILVSCVLLYWMLSRTHGSGRSYGPLGKQVGVGVVAVLLLSMTGLADWKSTSYFGVTGLESARGLLGHGAGEFLVNHGLAAAMAAGVVTLSTLLFCATIAVKHRNKTIRFMAVATALSLSAGLFGYLTLTLALVPGLFVAVDFFGKLSVRDKQNGSMAQRSNADHI